MPMLFRKFACIFSMTAACASAFAVEGYVCVADHAAGISFNKSTKQWSATVFKATERLLVSRASDAEASRGFKWVVKDVGSQSPSFFCSEEFNEPGYLHCKGVGDFLLNRRNGRYISTYMIGYVDDGMGNEKIQGEEGSNTPAIKAGKCSPL